MSATYLGYHFIVSPVNPGAEILLAELGELPFESFVENENGLSAYVRTELKDAIDLSELYILQNPEFTVTYTIEEIEQVNWNEEWEKNFQPIEVDGRCYVRAPFHPAKAAEFEIVIEPKMSFGTGHHETTHMMIQHLLDLDLAGKTVMDMGCGTAILAILAAMRGAKTVDAVDIDNWCYLNSIENVERNNLTNVHVYEGDASWLNNQQYDVFIANINRNILLNDLTSYRKTCQPGSDLLLSGFYEEDQEAITNCANALGWEFVKKISRNNWIALHFRLN